MKANSSKLKAYRLLTNARANTAETLPLVEPLFHGGGEKSATALVEAALKALDEAIKRVAAE